MKLSEKELKVMELIKGLRENKQATSVHELRIRFPCSYQTMRNLVNILYRKGALDRFPVNNGFYYVPKGEEKVSSKFKGVKGEDGITRYPTLYADGYGIPMFTRSTGNRRGVPR